MCFVEEPESENQEEASRWLDGAVDSRVGV